MNKLVPSLALMLLGLTVTAALVAGIATRAILVDETGSNGHILIVEYLGLAAGLALILRGLMSTFISATRQSQA
ncbi:hypothetical protein [Kocuria sp. SM24M-10]|uniref:hypothetical protein n=1 Tax=Kocuria sp. SM24M-10 TaxID=1660349 RepID=UPI000649351D|nr:hypothetical protein [Kocuria sp. SM24M-10]KLU09032.1 hypothetical protein ABL57_14700 [Kocuria sp. SM24M-10]